MGEGAKYKYFVNISWCMIYFYRKPNRKQKIEWLYSLNSLYLKREKSTFAFLETETRVFLREREKCLFVTKTPFPHWETAEISAGFKKIRRTVNLNKIYIILQCTYNKL